MSGSPAAEPTAGDPGRDGDRATDSDRAGDRDRLRTDRAGDGDHDGGRFRAARAVADAVLYEGYVLYPYRASAAKNQLRWQFGVLTPPAFSAAVAPGTERSAMRTECLVRVGADTRMHVRVRCLQLQQRAVEAASDDGLEFSPVSILEVGGEQYVAWDEAIEHVIDLPPLPCWQSGGGDYSQAFRLAGGSTTEVLCAEDGRVAGRLVRHRRPIEGWVRVATSVPAAGGSLVKVAVMVENRTGLRGAAGAGDLPDVPGHPSAAPDPRILIHNPRNTRVMYQNRRDEALAQSLVAVHTMLAVDGGGVVSLLDPPKDAEAAVADCHNDGWFPVLIGGGDSSGDRCRTGSRPASRPGADSQDDGAVQRTAPGTAASTAAMGDVVLSSPIILYDYPQVAPESPGDLYDATEIDEILALRVVTLTDGEKSEARATDPRAAAIIDRCDGMSPATWAGLHGIFRPTDPDRAGQPSAPGGPDGWVAEPAPGAADPAPGSAAIAVTVGAAAEPTAPAAGESLPWWDPAQDASVDPWTDTVLVAGVEVRKGTPVRLQPGRRCDAQDFFLSGQNATVAGVFTDVEGQPYVAVTVDDDPAAAELDWQGRYLYFYPDELAPRSKEDAPR